MQRLSLKYSRKNLISTVYIFSGRLLRFYSMSEKIHQKYFQQNFNKSAHTAVISGKQHLVDHRDSIIKYHSIQLL